MSDEKYDNVFENFLSIPVSQYDDYIARDPKAVKHILLCLEDDVGRLLLDEKQKDGDFIDRIINECYNDNKIFTTSQTMGDYIDNALRIENFHKYLIFLGYANTYDKFKPFTRQRITDFFTKNRYAAKKRLLRCRGVLPKDAASSLAGVVEKMCSGRKMIYGRKECALITLEFKKEFNLKRYVEKNNFEFRVLNTIPKSAGWHSSYKEFEVQIVWAGHGKPKSIKSVNALILLGLLHYYKLHGNEFMSGDVVRMLLKKFGYDVSGKNFWKRLQDSISHLTTRSLIRYQNLFHIDENVMNWRLVASKSTNIRYDKFFLHRIMGKQFNNPQKST